MSNRIDNAIRDAQAAVEAAERLIAAALEAGTYENLSIERQKAILKWVLNTAKAPHVGQFLDAAIRRAADRSAKEIWDSLKVSKDAVTCYHHKAMMETIEHHVRRELGLDEAPAPGPEAA